MDKKPVATNVRIKGNKEGSKRMTWQPETTSDVGKSKGSKGKKIVKVYHLLSYPFVHAPTPTVLL